jgi:hypothetical protein
MVKGIFLENLPKKLPHFKEESHEIVKIFGGFGQFFFLAFEIAISS